MLRRRPRLRVHGAQRARRDAGVARWIRYLNDEFMEMDVASPANPFQHLMAPPAVADQWTRMTTSAASVPEIISIEVA
ncbi:unnamed protein product [Urochloa humidicola]